MTKDKWIEALALAAVIFMAAAALGLLTSCRNIQAYKFYESGKLAEAVYTDEVAPQWSNKEALFKTGNIGINL